MAQVALERGLLLEIFDEMHVEQGINLMRHWNMPSVYCDVAARHHQEFAGDDSGPDNMVLAIVRLVNITTRKRGLSISTEHSDIPILELPEAQILKLADSQLMELYGLLEKSKEVEF